MITWNLQRELPDAWARRLPEVSAFLGEHAPDLLCLQEATAHQLADVRAVLPAHGCVAGAPDGRDEHNAILFARERYELLESGALGLPRTRRAIKRTATWARLAERATGETMTIVNAHLDHQSPRSRVLGAEKLLRLFPDAIVAGDLNAEPGTDPHDVLLRSHRDPFPASGAETMVGDGGPADARLDWILLPEGVDGSDPRVLRDAPSDHHALALDVRPRHVDEKVRE